jgi:hypothetical protein
VGSWRHLPGGGRRHGEAERRLQVGLLEHGEHATGVGNLELRVEVDLAVDRVDEAVQALAGVGVQAVGVDDQLVLGAQTLQGDARVGEGGRVDGCR